MIGLMAARGILPHLLPTPADVACLARLMALEPAARATKLCRLAALVGVPDAVEPTAQRLRLSKAEATHLAGILLAVSMIDQPACRLVRRVGRAAALDAVWLAEARGLAHAGAAALRDKIAAWVEQKLPVTGDDVLSLGVPPGRLVGELLGRLAAWWEERDCTADRAACLKKLKQLARAPTPHAKRGSRS
jgi:poly(A) polymerase